MKLLTINEVADILSVHRATVYGLIREGHLTPVWVGKHKRIRLQDVERYIEKNTEAMAVAS